MISLEAYKMIAKMRIADIRGDRTAADNWEKKLTDYIAKLEKK